MPSDPKKSTQAKTCGNCGWWTIQGDDLSMGACRAAIPTPVVVGMDKNLVGQVAFRVEHLRPMLPKSTPMCALFEEGEGTLILRAAGNG